ncbi:hypothetical protein CBS101457_002203 [Exobasidium rhododendri]|nr:hypothetical protein CBS101457_002203 [Exobasidium rhododendri]
MSAHTAQPADAPDDLDDLDDILDEFSKPEKPAAVVAANTSSTKGASSLTAVPSLAADGAGSAEVENGKGTEEELNEKFAKELSEGMEALMKGLGDPGGSLPGGLGGASATAEPDTADGGGETLFNEEEMIKQFEQMMADMGLGGMAGMDALGATNGTSMSSSANPKVPSSATTSNMASSSAPPPPANFQDAIKNTMSRLRESDASASTSTGEAGDGMDLEKLMAALGNGGEGMEGEEGIAKMLESMMGELMSKDVLYEPLKELKDKYPGYLANPPTLLSSEDRTRYEVQFRIVSEVIALFDDKKFDNGSEVEKSALKTRVQTLMNEMQDQGAPPAEIVGDLPPELGNMPGLGGAGDENCTIM